MRHHWRKALEPDAEGRPHLAGAICEWCRISKAFDDMPADIRTMFHSRDASDLRVAWAWLHTQFPGECPGPNPRYAPHPEAEVLSSMLVESGNVVDGLDGPATAESQTLYDYRVIYGNRLDVLCAEVGEAMAEGWRPHGSLAVHDDTNHLHCTLYYQPMVRP